ncbi:hypothetical protein CDL15_Pgr010849 [Punica granatum]|uniref:ApaG domain-containing protein n=1 Tax=Punica granatum TaxID=22663 RepID=A0A218W6Q3_PUNGR|nr:hypothetical protein CDL15_Pgr010849 [Punica granatum]
MELEAVGDLALHIILSKLGPENVGRVACVSKKLQLSASEDPLWSKFCSDELGLSSPLDPLGDPILSFKEAYKRWREAFRKYPWPLVKRVKRCWDKIEDWLSTNFPEAKATLRRGASEADLHEAEEVLKVQLPLPTRILYRFHDGQEITDDEPTARTGSPAGSLGLIGGYAFDGHRVNVYLLPLSQVVLETSHIVRHLGFVATSQIIVVASSCSIREKLFFLNCRNGQLYVGTRNLPTEGEMMPCVPNGPLKPVCDLNDDQKQDGMLLWLEEHGRRLQSGIIKVREEGKLRSISQYPEEPPLCTSATTNGIMVRGSAVFVPELTTPQKDEEKYLFSYSIRMSLLPEGCFLNGNHFTSCQLQWRHWIIPANDAVVDGVDGEGVIGEFPLPRAGDKEFVYESCSYQSSSRGSIEGSFTFIPGRYQQILYGFCFSIFLG